METSLTFGTLTALFGVMVVLSAIPSTSVLTVTARSMASGFIHGVFTATGIVVGDIIFILIAISGLALFAEAMGNMFVLVKYIGGMYLVWLGIYLYRSGTKPVESRQVPKASRLSSFMAGLLLTLGDQKAILFYLAFFPAFIDLHSISIHDTAIIISITIVAVGSVKLVYAYLADRINWPHGPSTGKKISTIAGIVLTGVGIVVITKT